MPREFFSDVLTPNDNQMIHSQVSNSSKTEISKFSIDVSGISEILGCSRGQDRFTRACAGLLACDSADGDLLQCKTLGAILKHMYDPEYECLFNIPNTVSSMVACIASGCPIITVAAHGCLDNDDRPVQTKNVWGILIDMLFALEPPASCTLIPLIIHGWKENVFQAILITDGWERSVEIPHSRIDQLGTSWCVKYKVTPTS